MGVYQRPIRPGELMHFGVLGMKWGVRRYQNPDGTLTAAGKKRYSREVGRSKKINVYERKRLKGSYEFYDKQGNRVGQSIVDDEGDSDHYDWIGIKEKHRRKGYGSEALDIMINDSIKRGKKYVTLDAAGLDPAAMHLYKKKGFEIVKQIEDNGIWNGLTLMRKELKNN